MSAIFISHSSKDNAVAGEIKAKLLEQGHRSFFLDFDPEIGIPAGHSWEQELYARLRGCQAMIVLCSEHSMTSPWCFAEITQARSQGKHLFPLKIDACQISPLLSDVQVTDLTLNPIEGYQRLWSGLKKVGLDPMDLFVWDGTRPPYPGLLAFQEQDAAVYFGRDAAIQGTIETLNRLQRLGGSRLVLVLGASGSGKSSLVRAGVVPRLKRDNDRWLVLEPFRPLGRPFDELAMVLAGASPRFRKTSDWKPIREALNPGADTINSAHLLDLANDLRVAAGRRETTVLLVVDQFEELLARDSDPSASLFLQLLKAVLSQPRSPFLAVATLRSDFLGAFQTNEVVQNLLYEPLHLPQMALTDFAQVIEGPAKVAGVELEAGLAQAMVADTATDDALPLLAFTLRELWDRHSGDGPLTLEEYRDRLGGLQGSLARAAETIFAERPLLADEELHLRKAFLSMVRVDEEGRYVRRPAPWNHLHEDAHGILERFVQARLLVSGSKGADRILEVAHEALFRSWDRLVVWLNTDREFLLWRQRLQGDMIEWEHNEHNESMLLRGPVLAEAERWLRERPDSLNETETEFIETSVALREHERATREWLRRRNRIIALAVIGIVSIAGFFAGWQWWQAEEQRNRAEAQKLAAQGNAVFAESSRYVDTSALLAVESMRLQPLLENDTLLRATLTLLPKQVARVNHEGPVRDFHFSPDSRYVATASDDRNARIFEAATGKEIIRLPHEDAISSIQFSPDGRYVATASDDKSVRIFEVITGKGIARLDLPDWVQSVQFSPDGRYIASRNIDKSARIFEAFTGKEVARVSHEGAIFSIQFSPDGRYVATASEDKSARIFEVATGKEVTRLPHEGAVSSVQFSPDGGYVATGSADNNARIFAVPTGKEIARLSHEGAVSSVQFSPDGRYLATASEDKSARIFEAVSGREIGRLNHKSIILDVQFSPDGRYIATASDDNNARIFEAATGKEITRLPHEGAVSGVQFSPDSQFVATGSVDNSARIFEVITGKEIAHVNHDDVVWRVLYSPDGRFVASSSYDKSVRVFQPTMGKGVAWLNHGGVILCVRFSPDGRYVAIGSFDWSARVFEAETGKEVGRLNQQGVVSTIEFSIDSQYVASGGADYSALIFEAARGKEIARLDHEGWVRSAGFSPDGRYVATGSADNSARIFAVSTGQEIARLIHDGPVTSVQFSPDGRYLATASDDTSARIFEAATGKELTRLPHEGAVSSVQFSPDGRYVATGSADNTARIFAVPTGKEIARLSHEGAVSSVQFSGDGRYMATASGDNSAHIFETATGKEITRLNHEGRIFDVQFSADGRYIATGGEDGRTRVFEAATGKEIARLPHQGSVWRVQFSPDERSLRSLVSTPGHLGVFSDPLVSEDLILETCRRLTRNLTSTEWKTYFPDAPYHKTCREIP